MNYINITTSLKLAKKYGLSQLNQLLFASDEIYGKSDVQQELCQIKSIAPAEVQALSNLIECKLVDDRINFMISLKSGVYPFEFMTLKSLPILYDLYINSFRIFECIFNDILFNMKLTKSLVKPTLLLAKPELERGLVQLVPLQSVGLMHVGKVIFAEAKVKRIGSVFQRVVLLPFESEGSVEIILIPQRKTETVSPKPIKKDFFINAESYYTIPAQHITLSDNILESSANIRLDALLELGLCYSTSAGESVIVGGVIELAPSKNKEGCISYLPLMTVTCIHCMHQVAKALTKFQDKFLGQLISKIDLWPSLIKKIAPSIQGHLPVKNAIALQLFCGKPLQVKGVHIRKSIHILLCGDAGVGKSQMLRSMVSFTSGLFASAAASSGVGLTATVVKDEKSSQWMIEAGAMVLADRRLLALDELDKIKQNESNSIHEAMEQQTVTVSKAGLHLSLNARTSVLAAANPKFGKFNSDEGSLIDQLTMPITLLSRFDLIFCLKDKPDTEKDASILSTMFSNFEDGANRKQNSDQEEACIEQLAERVFCGELQLADAGRLLFNKIQNIHKYIAYTLKLPPPEFTPATKQIITTFYGGLRKNKKGIVTFRQAESLIRLIESKARSRGAQRVQESDVRFCINLMIQSMKGISGKESVSSIDNNILDTGMGAKEKTKLDLVFKYVKSNSPVDMIKLRSNFSSWSVQQINATLFKLERLSLVFKDSQKKWRVIA